MISYKNLSDNSGVMAYELGDDYIIIQFQDGRIYLYDYASAGKIAIEQMKALAHKGEGLTTYINQHVRERYARKLN